MRWKVTVVGLVICAIAPQLFEQFASASVHAALQVLNGMFSTSPAAPAGPGHG